MWKNHKMFFTFLRVEFFFALETIKCLENQQVCFPFLTLAARLKCVDRKVFFSGASLEGLLCLSNPPRPLKHYNRLWLSWSHSAQMNVQIEPFLLHFPRTSFIVHALAKWFKRSNYSNSTFRAEVSWRKSKRKNFSLFWSFFDSRFPSFSFPFGCFYI